MTEISFGGFHRLVLNPATAGGIMVMLVNDFIIKPSGACPPLAGKLSDIAILFFLPPVLLYGMYYVSYLIHLAFHAPFPRYSRTGAAAAAVITGVYFILLKTSGPFNESHVLFINLVNPFPSMGPRFGSVLDRTDLFTLPMLVISYVFLARLRSRINAGPGD